MLIVSQAMLWVIVMLLVVAVLALARQVGVLHERIAPVGALALGRGPQPGEAAPKLAARTLANTTLHIGGPLSAGEMQLLFFVAPSCPVCKNLLPTAQAFAHAEALDLILIGDGEDAAHRTMADRFGITHERFVNAPEVGRAYQVGKLPYAVLVSELGSIVAQGLVNTREHLESLVVAHEIGLRSVQDYLHARRARRHQAQQEEHKHV